MHVCLCRNSFQRKFFLFFFLLWTSEAWVLFPVNSPMPLNDQGKRTRLVKARGWNRYGLRMTMNFGFFMSLCFVHLCGIGMCTRVQEKQSKVRTKVSSVSSKAVIPQLNSAVRLYSVFNNCRKSMTTGGCLPCTLHYKDELWGFA